MERAEGIIRKTDGDVADVFIKRHTMCGDSCATCGLCGDKETIVRAHNGIGAKTGDRVMVELKTENGLLGAFLAYGIPIIIMILGVIVITTMEIKQLLGVVGILIALAIWFLIVQFMEKKGVWKQAFGAEIVAKIEEEPNEEN